MRPFFRSFLVLFFFQVLAVSLTAQLVGGSGNGQKPSSEVTASNVNEGGISGSVNLFNGTYSASQTLGTVSNPGGLSFTATMSYGSTISGGDDMPHSSGIPYGEGWNIDVPMISVSTEGFNKYTVYESYFIGDDPQLTKEFCDPSSLNQDAYKEGRLYWFAPTLTIPGVGGGRMVYKKTDNKGHLFVLHRFEKYIEARFDGYRWEVTTDDGTVYEFGPHSTHRQASNQRVQKECYENLTGVGSVLPYLTLPKTEISAWYCTRMWNRNISGAINFTYQGYGAFDFDAVYKQPEFVNTVAGEWKSNNPPPLKTTYKDIYLKEINSGYQKLVFEHESINVSDGQNLLDIEDTDNVSRFDSLYSSEVIQSWGETSCGLSDFDGWARYKHFAHPDFAVPNTPASSKNPYLISSGFVDPVYSRELIGSQGSIVDFDHSFLESDRVTGLMHGDLYEVKTEITSTQPFTRPCLFDINVATGDNSYSIDGLSGNVFSEKYNKSRGESIFSTFNQAVKWNSSAVTQADGTHVWSTSSLFNLKNIPLEFDGITLQIGPSNSDMNYSFYNPNWIDDCGNTSEPVPYVLDAYFANIGDNPPNKTMGDDVSRNFGIGMPWHMMYEFSKALSPYSHSYTTWRHDPSQTNPCWANLPTRTEESKLSGVKLIRYSKNPYMLKSVKHYVFNLEEIPATVQEAIDAGWQQTAQLNFAYDIVQEDRYINVIYPGETQAQLKPQGADQKRNIVRLRKIIQMPTDLTGVDVSTLPTTHFSYTATTGLSSKKITNDYLFNGSYHSEEIDEYYGTDFHYLSQIVSPLGKITNIDYYPIGENGTKSKTFQTFKYIVRPGEQLVYPPSTSDPIKTANHYAYQCNLVVQSLSIVDRQGAVQTNNYNYGEMSFHNRRPNLGGNFIADIYYSPVVGFSNTVVTGPGNIATDYYHYVDYERWGKVNKVVSYDSNGSMVSERESTYDCVIAFEPPSHRYFVNYDYYGYYADELPAGRPVIDNCSSFGTYNVAIFEWMKGLTTQTEWQTWLESIPEHPVLSCETPGIPPGEDPDCNCHQYEFLDHLDKKLCFTYLQDYENHMALKPENPHVIFPLLDNPDQLVTGGPTGGTYDAPYFYESHYSRALLAGDSKYLYSFFIKKTKDKVTAYDSSCSGSEGHSISTTTDYEYFDTDYRGQILTPTAYQELLGDSYAALNGHLFWEPSWQLYSKKTYSDEYGGPDEAYTLEENFYLYDLVNDVAYLDDDKDVLSDFWLLYKLQKRDRARSIPFQTRVTKKTINETPITSSTHYLYRTDWEEFKEPVTITEKEHPNGDVSWPCDEAPVGGDPGGTGGTGGGGSGVVNECGAPCVKGGTNPDFPCYFMNGYFCQCCVVLPPNDDDSFAGGGGTGDPLNDPYDDPTTQGFVIHRIAGKIYLKSVVQQVSEEQGDKEVMRFDPTYFEPVFPNYDTLTVNTILLRNEHGQVVEEQNERYVVTRYAYSPMEIWTYEDCYNGQEIVRYLSVYNHVGLPVEVTVGYGRADALTNIYDYYPNNTISTITDPNGMVLSYNYDGFDRMTETYRNGALLKSVGYSNWDNNEGDSFKERAVKNNVTATDYVTTFESWTTTSYVDPIGRQVGTTKFGPNGAPTVDNNIYDIHGRPTISTNPGIGAPLVNFENAGPAKDHAEFVYDTAPRSRPLQASKYGLSIVGDPIVNYNYCIATDGDLATDLSPTGQELIPPGELFYKTTTTDEDGKSVVEYSNAIGQKAATITKNGEIGTVFFYDSHGGVNKVSNPTNQLSEYRYNYVGQLYEKETVDGGITKYGYDHSGNLLSELHGNGQARLYQYDPYSRMIGQYNTGGATYIGNQGMQWLIDTDYATYLSILNASIPEKKWFYEENDQQWTIGLNQVALNYLASSQTYTKGRVVQTVSFELNSTKAIDVRFYSYTNVGFLKWEIDHFNYNGISSTSGLLTRIDYAGYNLQGGNAVQNVDLNSDMVLDFQYYYDYDSWNRIEGVYASFDQAGGSLIASYEYDDTKGVVKYKRYYASDEEAPGCLNQKIDEVFYTYDKRHRLKRKISKLFDWELYYDDDDTGLIAPNPDGLTENFNGNINTSFAEYRLTGSYIENPATYFWAFNTYNYTYDELNRLTKADGYLIDFIESDNSPDLANFYGDSDYIYDKVGNINYLTRWEMYGTDVNQSHYQCAYTIGTNKLAHTSGASPSEGGFWTYTYDGSGNLTKDGRKKINSVTYGRAHLPWKINQYTPFSVPTPTEHNYKYDVNDARIYKSALTRRGSPASQEFYLRDASGRELAIIDLNESKVDWYIYGNERVAKVPDDGTRLPDGGGSPPEPPGSGECEHTSDPRDCPEYRGLTNGQYASMADVDLSQAENQLLLQTLQQVVGLDTASGNPVFLFPDTLYEARLSSGQVTFKLHGDLNTLPQGATIEGKITLDHPRQRIAFTSSEQDTILLSLQMALGFAPYEIETPSPPTDGSDPSDTPIDDPDNQPLPKAEYYIYDHLGNTRITYAPNLSCDGSGNSGGVSITYTLKHVLDYFPYGKVMREFRGAHDPEKFLTTYHQRDVESGLDYRGARFYDCDIGRFLSLDPLAADFAGWSPYNYVMGNPVRLIDPSGRAPEEANEESGWSKMNKDLADRFGVFGGGAGSTNIEDWIPSADNDGNISLKYEEGDDYQSLVDFFGSEDVANELLPAWAKNATFQKGSKVKLNETPYSTAIKNFDETCDLSYHCHVAAMWGTQGLHFDNISWETATTISPLSRDEYLRQNYDEVPLEDAIFGKTYIAWNGDHSAVFFGNSRNGTTYVFQKDGTFYGPHIKPIDPERSQGIKGFYNPK